MYNHSRKLNKHSERNLNDTWREEVMKKIFAIALALCLVLCAVTASAEGVLEKIKSAGALVVGTSGLWRFRA